MPRLKHFDMVLDDLNGVAGHPRLLSEDKMGSVDILLNRLPPVAPHLEAISIDVEWQRNADFLDFVQPLRTLSGFSNLRELIVPQDFLFQRDMDRLPIPDLLPTSLTRIALIAPTSLVLVWYQEVVAHKGELPLLKWMDVYTRTDRGVWYGWCWDNDDDVWADIHDAGMGPRIRRDMNDIGNHWEISNDTNIQSAVDGEVGGGRKIKRVKQLMSKLRS